MENYFDQMALNWDENPMNILRTKAVAEEIIKLLNKTGKNTALEFGSGTGLLSFALKDYFSIHFILIRYLGIACHKAAYTALLCGEVLRGNPGRLYHYCRGHR